MSDFDDLVETLGYATTGSSYNGVVGFDEDRGYVDVDRVNVNLDRALTKHEMAPVKVKEDANPEDGIVRIWFRSLEIEVSL